MVPWDFAPAFKQNDSLFPTFSLPIKKLIFCTLAYA
jgi:hypothetical protein